MSNNFVPITPDDEEQRSYGFHQRSESAPENQRVIESVSILKFDEKSNSAEIITSEGISYTVRVRTPFDMIYLIWGDPNMISNIPATLFYRFSPDDGFVDLGGPHYSETTEADKAVDRPFSF